MTVELHEVRDFLAASDPFAQLPANELSGLPQHMSMRYVRRSDAIISAGQPNDMLFIIRSGAVDVLDSEGTLLDRRDAGRSFGFSTLMGDNTCRYSMIAVEDTLLLTMPREPFVELAERNPELARFFSGQSARMRAAAAQLRQESSSDVLRTQLGDFKIPNPATVTPDTTIQDAARIMEDRNVSSLLVSQDGGLEGIVTDRDMRGRVVANNMDVTLPVTEIMTPNPRAVTSDSLAFEAMLIMADMRIHHLPVVDEGAVTGIIASADIMRLLRHDPIYLTADLSRRTTPEDMREVYESAADVAVRFIERGASAEEVTGLLTVAADSLARRLITLAEEQLGPPPVPYAFVVLGSQGRRGMGLASDQDNALILDDSYDPDLHGDYFKKLADYVCTGLDSAGQVLCPGDMMAMNPDWRMTVTQWTNTFHTWITAPEPEALLHAQTFFDMRAIHGVLELADNVHTTAVDMAAHSGRLHAHLATLAARREPPLGFFRGFVVDRSGDYANTLDVKKGGTAAIVQMARLYALSAGIDAVGTRPRLQAAASAGAVSERGAEDLIDAFDFLTTISLRQNAEQLRRGQKPNYHIDPKELGKLDREHLRDAFQIIKGMQSALSTQYPVRSM